MIVYIQHASKRSKGFIAVGLWNFDKPLYKCLNLEKTSISKFKVTDYIELD